MAYEHYKILHVVSIIGLFMALGSLAMAGAMGASGADSAAARFRKPLLILHGVGMFIVLVSGFGLLARLGITKPIPGWVYGKIAIWLCLGGVSALLLRRPHLSKITVPAILLLASIAAYLVFYRPT